MCKSLKGIYFFDSPCTFLVLCAFAELDRFVKHQTSCRGHVVEHIMGLSGLLTSHAVELMLVSLRLCMVRKSLETERLLTNGRLTAVDISCE